MTEYVSPIDALLDENNDDNIVLYDDKDTATEFVQIAVIGLNGKIYPLLQPAQPMEGLGEDEALVFVIDEIDGEECLYIETDEAVIDEVFREYFKLLKDMGIE
ncbi:MAG: DUF1292 domain-containing protein [Clostridia bacterium]|nr:DUF1292 domain-containing protein [Clostridia bacterium]